MTMLVRASSMVAGLAVLACTTLVVQGFLVPDTPLAHRGLFPSARGLSTRRSVAPSGPPEEGLKARFQRWKSKGRRREMPSLEELSKEQQGEKRASRWSSLLPLAAVPPMRQLFPMEFNRGLGINPIINGPLHPYMPWISLLVFMIFCFKGMDPIVAFFVERKQKWKQRTVSEEKKKQKRRSYRNPSRLYELAKAKLDMAASNKDKDAGNAAATGEGGATGEQATEEEEEPRLSAWRCEDCGFTLYPARGREFRFLTDRFRCPSCGATKEKFYDATDPDDPRNQPSEETEEVAEGGDDDLELPEEGDLALE